MSRRAFRFPRSVCRLHRGHVGKKQKRVARPGVATVRETDLYAPVRDFLLAQGFTVRAEVRGCDVTAVKSEHMVVVELKLGLTLDLLLQGVRRQRIADLVYLAVPRPATRAQETRLRANLVLLRQLELGLLVVDLREQPPTLTVAQQPLPFQRRSNSRERKALLREVALRSGDDNAGGIRGRPLVTAYRENALLIAVALARFGPLAPKQLRALGTGEKTRVVLYDDVYGWFEHLGPALYRLKPKGEAALQTYLEVAQRISARLPTVLPPLEDQQRKRSPKKP